MKLVVEKEDLEVLVSKSTDKVRMAGVAPPLDANGATIIFHCTADDTVLVGEEGNWLVEDNSPHYFAGDEDIVTTCLDPTGKTREQLTIEAIPRIRQQIINLIDDGSKPKKNLLPNVKAKLSNFNEIVYPIVTRDSRNNCAKPVAGGPVLQRYFSYVTKRKSDPTKRSLGFPKGGRKKDRTTKQYTESVVECAQRELYEEIGNIGAGGESILPGGGISIDNADFVDYDGKGSEKYAIYYKRITDVEKHLIERVIDRRRNLLIGETFDLRFVPRSQLDKIKLNDKSKLAKGFIQAPPPAPAPAPAPAPVPPSPPLVLPAGATIPKTKSERDNARRAINLQARGKLVPPHLRKYLGTGGAKKTRRRITRKRRTTSKRR